MSRRLQYILTIPKQIYIYLHLNPSIRLYVGFQLGRASSNSLVLFHLPTDGFQHLRSFLLTTQVWQPSLLFTASGERGRRVREPRTILQQYVQQHFTRIQYSAMAKISRPLSKLRGVHFQLLYIVYVRRRWASDAGSFDILDRRPRFLLLFSPFPSLSFQSYHMSYHSL